MDYSELFSQSRCSDASYINLDNAATTPAADPVRNAVNAVLDNYGSVNRGSGKKSLLTTAIYEASTKYAVNFFGAEEEYTLLHSTNTTGAINRIASLLDLAENEVILISEFEHTSNILPWIRHKVKFLGPLENGNFAKQKYQEQIEKITSEGNIPRLLVVSAASNVTGLVSDVKGITKLAHECGISVFFDAAQLVAHRELDLSDVSEMEKPDFVAFAGHKMYAPYGYGGVLVKKRWLVDKKPDLPGGGTILMVQNGYPIWETNLTKKFQPGTPNVIGLVAVCAAMRMLKDIGFENIKQHEAMLAHRGREVFANLPEVELFSMQPEGEDYVPIFSFNHKFIPHYRLSEYLSSHYNIGVRSGHLCQFEFMRNRLSITEKQEHEFLEAQRNLELSPYFGMVRASCGLENTLDDIDKLANAIAHAGEQSDLQKNEKLIDTSQIELKNRIPDELRFLDNYL